MSVFSLVQVSAATRWFVSNPSGQTIRGAFSLAALREKYALSITDVEPARIPAEYRRHYTEGWAVELRTLYEEGGALRTQWVFLDERRITRFVGAKSSGGAGFTERYDEAGLLTEESRYDAPVEEENDEGEKVLKAATPFVISYSYKDSFLVSARSNDWVDTYRYTRDNQIRLIDRRYTADRTLSRITMPRNPRNAPLDDPTFVRPSSTYTSSFLADILSKPGMHVTYQLDDKGRIVTETRHNAEGDVTGTLVNNWEGDRITSIVWESGDDRRRVTFEHNSDGDRIKEQNYRNDVLEREVVSDGADSNRETETLYIDGKPVLKAVWENGRKISEEQVDGVRRRR